MYGQLLHFHISFSFFKLSFRHKDRFISKLHSLYFTTLCDDSSQPSPSVSVAPEGVALVTFVPTKSNKEHPPSDENESEENEEQKPLREMTDAKHFNNTSYFFLQREWKLCRKKNYRQKMWQLILLDCFPVPCQFYRWHDVLHWTLRSKVRSSFLTLLLSVFIYLTLSHT